MTVPVPVHRALSAKLAGRSFNVVTRLGYNPWLQRVNCPSNDKVASYSTLHDRTSRISAFSTRTYATKASKPAGRPKAHTGRTTRGASGKKPGPKTAAGKAKVGRKPKKATKKPKKKPAAKVKKPKSRSAILKETRDRTKTLKEAALLSEPKQLPSSQWSVLFSEVAKSGAKEFAAGTSAKEAAAKYRNLSPEEKEHYNHIANQNKAENEREYKKWTQSYTPEQIHKANVARRQLSKDFVAKHPKKKQTNKFAPIHDDRLVKSPVSSYIMFSKDRHASGDFANMAIGESSKLIGREWKALSGAEKKKYEDLSAADLNRYYEEYRTVYGHEAQTRQQSTRTRRTRSAAA